MKFRYPLTIFAAIVSLTAANIVLARDARHSSFELRRAETVGRLHDYLGYVTTDRNSPELRAYFRKKLRTLFAGTVFRSDSDTTGAAPQVIILSDKASDTLSVDSFLAFIDPRVSVRIISVTVPVWHERDKNPPVPAGTVTMVYDDSCRCDTLESDCRINISGEPTIAGKEYVVPVGGLTVRLLPDTATNYPMIVEQIVSVADTIAKVYTK